MIGIPLIIAAKARARLQAVLAAKHEGVEAYDPPDVAELPDPADVVINACEINTKHGTGTLLLRIFPDSTSIISLRTNNFYDSDQNFGAAQLCLPLAQSARAEIVSWLKWYLGGANVRHILCLPYTPAEALVALAAQEILSAPLCTYVMDDKNVCAEGISDELMHQLFAKSRLRLVISPEMREAYQAKYHMRFWVMPPVVAEEIIQKHPVPTPPATNPPRCALLGNIWGQRWLEFLPKIFRGSNIEIDWYCNSKDPSGLAFDRAKLSEDGIHLRDPVAEMDLPNVLKRYPFALVPSDPLDGKSPGPVRAIAQLSLPSRMVTLMATSHLPMLVLGSPQTCAAGFVTRFQLGIVAPYERKSVSNAIKWLMSPSMQTDIRARSAALAGYFSAQGTADWIWRSLDAGKPVSFVYEELMPEQAAEELHF
ncbi:MAG: hypothetical protein WBD42_06670 [Methylovirgula sp.]